MTPAARFIAGLYEQAVDAGLNVTQVRCHLASRDGYDDSHPAPTTLSLAQIDRQIGY